MTQQDLAVATGLKQPQISRLETGDREPRLRTAQRLADALGFEPDAIFPEDGPTPGEVLAAHLRQNGRRRRR